MRNEYGFPETRKPKIHSAVWFYAGIITGIIIAIIFFGALR